MKNPSQSVFFETGNDSPAVPLKLHRIVIRCAPLRVQPDTMPLRSMHGKVLRHPAGECFLPFDSEVTDSGNLTGSHQPPALWINLIPLSSSSKSFFIFRYYNTENGNCQENVQKTPMLLSIRALFANFA